MKIEIGDRKPYKGLIGERLQYDQPVVDNDLRPYTSLVLARMEPEDTLLVNQVYEDIKKHVLHLQAERIVTESGEILEDAFEEGRLFVRFIHYMELRAPGWYNWPQVLRDKELKGSDIQDQGVADKGFKVEDVLNHLVVVCQRNQYVAIYLSDARRRRDVIRSIGERGKAGFEPLRPISPGTLKAAFVRQYEAMKEDSVVKDKYPVRTLWLSGIHAPVLVKPDSKILAGRNLRHALDPLADQTYCLTAARSFIHDLKLAVGVSPRGSRVWAGLSKNWADFERRVLLLLSELEKTEHEKGPLRAPLPVLATLSDRYEPADLSEPFELHWAPPELQVDDPDADYWTTQRMERWAYRASFDNFRFCKSPLGVLNKALDEYEVVMTGWDLENEDEPQVVKAELKLEPGLEPAELKETLQNCGLAVEVEPKDEDGEERLIAAFRFQDLEDERCVYLLQADAEVEGEHVGQLKVELEISTPQHVRIRATAHPVEGADKEYQKDLTKLCHRTDWMKMWFESGHTIANGAIYLIQHRDQPFESFRWADFSGYEVDWEKFWEGSKLARIYGDGFTEAVQKKVESLPEVSKVEMIVQDDCLQVDFKLGADLDNGALEGLETQLEEELKHAKPLTVHWCPDKERGRLVARVYGKGLGETAREAVENLPDVDSVQLFPWDAYLLVKFEKSYSPSPQAAQFKEALEQEGATVRAVHWHGTGLDKATIGQQGSLFCWVVNEWTNAEVNPLSVERGWLACDDGSGEIADFIHLKPEDQNEQPLLSLVHVKAADSNKPVRRSIKVGAYDVVSTQAVKNLRFLDQACLEKGLKAGVEKTISDFVWLDDRQVDPDEAPDDQPEKCPRDHMCDALGEVGSSYRRQVIVLQPQLTKHWYDRAREAERKLSMDPDHQPPKHLRKDIERLRQLDTLLLSAQASCRDLGAEFFVLADRR